MVFQPVNYDRENPSAGFKKLRSLLDDARISLLTRDLSVSGQALGMFMVLAQIREIEDPELRQLAYTAVLYALMRFAVLDKITQDKILTKPELLRDFLNQDSLLAGRLDVRNGVAFLNNARLTMTYTTLQVVQSAA